MCVNPKFLIYLSPPHLSPLVTISLYSKKASGFYSTFSIYSGIKWIDEMNGECAEREVARMGSSLMAEGFIPHSVMGMCTGQSRWAVFSVAWHLLAAVNCALINHCFSFPICPNSPVN